MTFEEMLESMLAHQITGVGIEDGVLHFVLGNDLEYYFEWGEDGVEGWVEGNLPN